MVAATGQRETNDAQPVVLFGVQLAQSSNRPTDCRALDSRLMTLTLAGVFSRQPDSRDALN